MSQIGSSLSAVYQPQPAAGPSPLRFVLRRDRRLGAVRDAGGVRQQIADRDRPPRRHLVDDAALVRAPPPSSWRTRDVAAAGSLSASLPSSMSDRMATLVIALVCDAMRKIVSVVISRPASLSAHPNAFS